MPYVIITAQVRLETGPTRVGDADSDPEHMASLGAELISPPGVNFNFWQTPWAPRKVINRLHDQGYRLVSSTGVGQTFVVTLFKD